MVRVDREPDDGIGKSEVGQGLGFVLNYRSQPFSQAGKRVDLLDKISITIGNIIGFATERVDRVDRAALRSWKGDEREVEILRLSPGDRRAGFVSLF